jgi:hypothetical protein
MGNKNHLCRFSFSFLINWCFSIVLAVKKQDLFDPYLFFSVGLLMINKLLILFLLVVSCASLIVVMPTVRADEMFFVDFFVVDSGGVPLSGVEIEVTGINNYHEFVHTGSDGYAPRLTLISDQRNAHYFWTVTYQLESESGDFYVPNNYNPVNIVMSDVGVSTPTPSPSPTPTPTSAVTLTPTPSPSAPPSSSPSPTTNPTTNPTSTINHTVDPTAAPTANPNQVPTQSPTVTLSTATPQPSPTMPEIPFLIIPALMVVLLAYTVVYKGRRKL